MGLGGFGCEPGRESGRPDNAQNCLDMAFIDLAVPHCLMQVFGLPSGYSITNLDPFAALGARDLLLRPAFHGGGATLHGGTAPGRPKNTHGKIATSDSRAAASSPPRACEGTP